MTMMKIFFDDNDEDFFDENDEYKYNKNIGLYVNETSKVFVSPDNLSCCEIIWFGRLKLKR